MRALVGRRVRFAARIADVREITPLNDAPARSLPRVCGTCSAASACRVPCYTLGCDNWTCDVCAGTLACALQLCPCLACARGHASHQA